MVIRLVCFPFNSKKNLDQSSVKMDLDFWDSFGKIIIIGQNFYTTELYNKIWGNFRAVVGESHLIPYFFGYKTEFFSFQNNSKDLDPSCRMDLDLWNCLGRVKLVL